VKEETMISKKIAALSAIVLLAVIGCASNTVTMTVQRTPTIDTTGIRRISIMPFEPNGNSSDHREIAGIITGAATTRIQNTRHFTLVDPAEIQRMQSRRESIENHVDALFTGRIVTLNTRDFQTTERRYDSRTRTNVDVTVYNREVELAFEYSFRRARDGSVIGTATKRGRNADKKDSRGELRSVSALATQIVNHRLATLYRDVAPYTVQEKRTLEEEKSSNRDLQNRMKSALSLIKEGNYRGALRMYLDIYGTFNNFAAAMNATIMHEALGETSEAAGLMTHVVNETGNPRARRELDRLNKVLEDEGLLATAYSDTRNQRQRVAAHAISEVQSILPRNANVWIVNKSERGENTLAMAVIDDLTAALIQNRVTVVDRANNRLMEAEQQFHLSGNVSDNDFMNIGNAAGANTLITVEIIGVGSLRRLRLEVLDIERRTKVFTSTSNDSWNL
jgi:hypothetical protein